MSEPTSPHAPGRSQQVVKNPVPWYSPRFWHGMRLSTWLGHLARNRVAVSPSQVPAAISITALTTINSLLSRAERAIYGRRVDAVQIEKHPLFIIGHWRSGTTFLHELLIRDPLHAYPTTYQCFVPHHFLLTEAWLAPWTEFLLPKRRPMDNMAAGWRRPQEDEFALGNLGVPTPYLSMMFPRRGPVFGDYLTLESLSEEQRRRWRQEFRRFVQRIQLRDSRRVVVKSPGHTARVATLLDLFPDAKFIHLVRDPQALYSSTVSLWKSLNEVQGMQTAGRQEWVDEYVFESFERMYQAFEADRPKLATDQLIELRYEDLAASPEHELERMYRQLGLGDFSAAKPAMEDYLAQVKNYRPNRYDLDPATRDQVNQRWQAYRERYGYDGGHQSPVRPPATASQISSL